MKLILTLTAIFLALATPAYAEGEPAFIWPDAYVFSATTSSKTNKFEPFVNVYYKDGLKARNQGKSGVEIFRVDMGKKYSIDKAGNVTESSLPADWSLSNFFPPNAEWKLIGQHSVKGIKMNKYAVSNAAVSATVWLSADNQTPFGMETNDVNLEFSSYKAQQSDPKLFDVPAAKKE